MKTASRVLYVVSLATFMRSFAQVIYSPSLVTMRADLNTSTTMIGLTLSVYGLILAFAQIAYGPIVDRFDTRRILIVGLCIFTLASIGGFIAGGIWLLLVVRGLQAVGIAAAASVGIAMIADLFPPGRRGHAMSIFETFNAAGAAAGPLAGGAMAVWFNWRVDFLVLAVFAGALVVAAVWSIPAMPFTPVRVGLADIVEIGRTAATFGALVLGFAHFYGLYTVHTMLPLLLADQYGLTEGRIGTFLVLLPVGVIAGSLTGGRRSDHTGSRLPVLVGTAGAALAFAFLALLSSGNTFGLPLIYVAVAVLVAGILMGFCLPVLIKIMVEHFPVIRGTAGALQYFARFAGSTFAPVVTGYLADSLGLPFGFGSAAVIIGLGWLVGILVIADPLPQVGTA